MELEYVEAKSILGRYQETQDYINRDYNMNLYRGCSHGCIYCDSRSACYKLENFDTVRPKKDALTILKDELRRKRKSGIVASGAMSDPYNPLEAELELTRGALILLADYGFGVSITTKSPLVARDADVLREINKSSLADVRLTITAAGDSLAKLLEPNAPMPSERFKALEALSKAGIYTGVFITPVLPFITDNSKNLLEIVQRAADCGAKNIVCMMGMTLRTGNREYYYKGLDAHFPGVKQRYITHYGESYVCVSPDAKELWEKYAAACVSKNVLCKMRDINAEMRALEQKQLSLFDGA